MLQNRRSPLAGLTPVVKHILVINVLFWIFTPVLKPMGLDLTQYLAIYFPKSELFNPYQYITYMFMHAELGSRHGFSHILFNMFALYMFGKVLESVWGSKRFFIYYFVTGIGAAIIHLGVQYINYTDLAAQLQPEQLLMVQTEGASVLAKGMNYSNEAMKQLNYLLNTPTVGASGAVFGLLLAFGMLFPNTQLMLLFPPIPIKAKYFVMGYGAIELFMGLNNQAGDSVAHFAHLGGMLFGFILIKYWSKKRNHLF